MPSSPEKERFRMSWRRWCAASVLLSPLIGLLPAARAQSGQVNVLTYHNDLARTGQNLDETLLSPTTVSKVTFGKLFSHVLDGQVYSDEAISGATNDRGALQRLLAARQPAPVFRYRCDLFGRGYLRRFYLGHEPQDVFIVGGDRGVGRGCIPRP